MRKPVNVKEQNTDQLLNFFFFFFFFFIGGARLLFTFKLQSFKSLVVTCGCTVYTVYGLDCNSENRFTNNQPYLRHIVRKLDFYLCKNKGADQLRSNCKADQRLCFRYTDSTISLLLKTKISSFCLLLGLYRSVCVRPGRKPRRPVFSHHCSFAF